MPVIVTLISTVWGFFIHANLRWRFGPLEWFISTPAFHHWHHTKTGPINRNYASTLPWLDWIFGTHYLPKEWPDSYGIDSEMPESLIGQLAYPLNPNPLAPSQKKPAETDLGKTTHESAAAEDAAASRPRRQVYERARLRPHRGITIGQIAESSAAPRSFSRQFVKHWRLPVRLHLQRGIPHW